MKILSGLRIRLNSIASQSLLLGVLSTVSILTGVAPQASLRFPHLLFTRSASAQSISAEEVNQYARSLLAIEPLRLQAYDEMRTLLGSVPPIECSDSNTVNVLPAQNRSIAVNYCEQSKKMVESNGLRIDRFNAITEVIKTDPELQKRIREELIRLQ